MASIPDYDEDVILPSSPLSQYMPGFEFFENDNFTENEELPIMKNETFSYSFNFKQKLTCFLQIILEGFKQYLSFMYNIFVPCLVPFEYSELKCVLNAAKNSKVLISEDLSVLLNYDSDDDSHPELKLSYSSVFQQVFQLFAFVLIYMIMNSITLSSLITNEDLIILFSNKSYFVYVLLQFIILIISIALYINIFIISAFIMINIIELILCKVFCYTIRKKLHATDCIMIMIRKCVRLIQEAELIARGFTSASVPGIVERLELSTGLPINSPERQYPELRKCIFKWTKEMFVSYRNSTLKLIENKQFGPVLDFSSQSFAVLDLKEFGNLLKYDINFDSDLHELLKLTDGLSVSSLKTMYLLLELQVSEFYKYLYLITSFLISDDSLLNCSKKIYYFRSLNSFLKVLQKKDMDILKMSCDTHKYYKSIESVSDVEEKALMLQESSSSNLEICMHNMSLHLKSALKRLTELEDLLEAEKKSNKVTSEKCMKKVADIMKEIDSEIAVYHDYYLKCNNEIQTSLHGEKESPSELVVNEQNLDQKKGSKVDVITSCDCDPVIEDEIFEAIVTKSLREREEKNFDDYPAERQKCNSEVTGKLLHELKNVLVVKADEHRIREAKAMAKKTNIFQEAGINASEQLSDPVRNEGESESRTKEAFSDSSDVELSKESESHVSEESIDLSSDCDVAESPVAAMDKLSDSSQSGLEDTKNINNESKPHILSCPNRNAFAASIAALALQRQEKLGIVNDECFSDGNDSEDEIISN